MLDNDSSVAYKNADYHLDECVAVCTCMMSAKVFMISLFMTNADKCGNSSVHIARFKGKYKE